MARKGRQTLTEAPPPAVSSSEDSDSDSDDSLTSSHDKSPINSNNNNNDSSSSSDDDADDLTQPPQQPPNKPHQPPPKPHLSDSESDSDSDSDSDPKPPPADHPKSKPASLPVSNKRKSVKDESSDKSGSTPKKLKKEKSDPSGTTPAPDEGSKKLFQRFWSEDDEIVILKGLIEFKANKGKDPMSDVDGFLDFIKTSLHVSDVKKDQIVNKVRRLKGRFQNAKNRTLTNPHDLQAFELSKSIWGEFDDEKAKGPSKNKSKVSNVKSKGVKNGAVNGGVLVDVEKKEENGDENIKSDEGNVANANGGIGASMRTGVCHGIQPEELTKFGNVDEKFIAEGMKLLGDAERDVLEEEWFNFNVAQMEVLVRRLEFYKRTAKAVLNALKSTTR